MLQLGSILIKVFHILNQDEIELQGTATLLLQRFRAPFLIRLGSLLLIVVLVPLVSFVLLQSDPSSTVALCIGMLLVVAIASEMLGRHLFYVTVVPQKRPGGFFS